VVADLQPAQLALRVLNYVFNGIVGKLLPVLNVLIVRMSLF
jgi:hypothetical protein|tara:strand:- start:409 stop:531 length:123 start_codon:yes stop_codon:yes gene_type:complete